MKKLLLESYIKNIQPSRCWSRPLNRFGLPLNKTAFRIEIDAIKKERENHE